MTEKSEAAEAKKEAAAVAKEEAKVNKAVEEAKASREAEMQECLEKATVILKSYNGMESDVPVSSEYWQLMNKYRALLNR